MALSVFDIFRIGIGPSSSHTVGPMIAANRFRHRVAGLPGLARVQADLFGSLALTGKGHGTDRAIVLGLACYAPATLCPDEAEGALGTIRSKGMLEIGGRDIAFDEAVDLRFLQRERLPFHSNGMRFRALDSAGGELDRWQAYSGGSGAIVAADEVAGNSPPGALADFPHPFASAAQFLARAEAAGLRLAELALANECALRPPGEVEAELDKVLAAMTACIDRGMRSEGVLPGGLNVRRRAPLVREWSPEDVKKALESESLSLAADGCRDPVSTAYRSMSTRLGAAKSVGSDDEGELAAA